MKQNPILVLECGKNIRIYFCRPTTACLKVLPPNLADKQAMVKEVNYPFLLPKCG
jgi:hypothetical protein